MQQQRAITIYNTHFYDAPTQVNVPNWSPPPHFTALYFEPLHIGFGSKFEINLQFKLYRILMSFNDDGEVCEEHMQMCRKWTSVQSGSMYS